MRFLDSNFLLATGVTATASSEDADFPVSNLQKHSPSRVWRSSGNFVIDATNNKLDFKENGIELNATIASATYTPTTLAAAIKAAMEVVTLLARTYTVSYSVLTGKWTITEDSTTFLSLLWSSGTNTATSIGATIGFAVSDDTGATTYTGANIAIHTEETVVVDLQTTEDADSIAVMFSPLNGIKLSSSAVVKIQANATDTWAAPAVDVTLTVDEEFFLASHFFSTSESYRFWRLQIVDTANTNLHIEIGGLIIAEATVLTQAPERGFTHNVTDQSKQIRNDFGNEYVDELPFLKTISFSYKVLQYVDVKTLEAMFRTNGVRIPVMVVIDENEDCFDKDHFVVYGKFQRTLSHKQVNFTLFDEDLTIREIL